MSSSEPNSKIDFLDSPKAVKKKISGAFCEEGNITKNGVLAFTKVIISINNLRAETITAGGNSSKPLIGEGAPAGTVFSIARKEEWGGPLHYSSFEQMETDFAERRLHPGDLKQGVTDAIVSLLEPVQKAFESSPDFQAAALHAYPDPAAAAPKPGKKKVCLFLLNGFHEDLHRAYS